MVADATIDDARDRSPRGPEAGRRDRRRRPGVLGDPAGARRHRRPEEAHPQGLREAGPRRRSPRAPPPGEEERQRGPRPASRRSQARAGQGLRLGNDAQSRRRPVALFDAQYTGEYEAEVVLGVWRPVDNELRISILKNRNGEDDPAGQDYVSLYADPSRAIVRAKTYYEALPEGMRATAYALDEQAAQ